MAKVTLTDRFIKSAKRVPATGRKDWHDALVPGLALRVSASGHRAFVLVTRYPGASLKNRPTRRALGACYVPPDDAPPSPVEHRDGALTLSEAREKARDWLSIIKRGTDPKIAEDRRRAEAQRAQANTFAYVAEEFLTRHAAQLAHAKKARSIIEAEFVGPWGARPVTDILPEEAAAAIRAVVKRGSPYQAHSAYEWLRRLYNWAIGTSEFGIMTSPVAALRPSDLIGKKESRDRTLTDDEIRAIWRATGGTIGAGALKEARRRDRKADPDMPMSYPYAPLIRFLLLTGQREHEAANARWSEFDLDAALWTIPSERMKGDRAHVVPLGPDALALFKALPRFKGGSHVFTTTAGEKPVNGFSKAKARLDRLSGVTGWRFHDLRRTMRTHLSALPIEDRVREAMIAHAQPGLHRVYDLHSYGEEKRRGFELWEQRLRGILAPKPPAEVANLAAERGMRGAA